MKLVKEQLSFVNLVACLDPLLDSIEERKVSEL